MYRRLAAFLLLFCCSSLALVFDAFKRLHVLFPLCDFILSQKVCKYYSMTHENMVPNQCIYVRTYTKRALYCVAYTLSKREKEAQTSLSFPFFCSSSVFETFQKLTAHWGSEVYRNLCKLALKYVSTAE